MYAITFFTDLYYSADEGIHWSPVDVPRPMFWDGIDLADPLNSAVPYVLTHTGIALLDSIYARPLPSFDSLYVASMYTDESAARRHLLVSSRFYSPIHFRSLDSGESWERLTDTELPFPVSTSTSRLIRDTLYTTTASGECHFVTWEMDAFVQLPYTALDPSATPWVLGDGIMIMQYDSSVVRSSDGGNSWFDSRVGLPSIPVSIEKCVRSVDGSIYILLNDKHDYQKLFRSADRGRTWNQVYRNGDGRITDFQLLRNGEILWYFGSVAFARSDGLAMAVDVDRPPIPSLPGLYPNPLRSGESVTVLLGENPPMNWECSIIDASGRNLHRRSVSSDRTGALHLHIPSRLSPGSYFLLLRSGTHIHLHRLQLR